MANRYWVGGTASWDGTAGTKWATTSGGTGGASLPTTSDDVFFDANSGANTVTVATGNTGCKSITCTGFTGTLTGSASLTVEGSITFVSGMTSTLTGQWSITGSGTIISAGKTMPFLLINGFSITVNQGDDFTFTSSPAVNIGCIALSVGTYNTNNYNITCNITSGNLGGGINVSSATGVRAINLGSSTITITLNSNNNPPFFGNSNNNNLTFNAGTSTYICKNLGGASSSFQGNGLTFYNVVFENTSSTAIPVTGANTFNNLTLTGRTTNGLGNFTFAANQTITGTLTASAGTNASMRHFIRSSVAGTARTLTCAAVSITDVDFQDITIAGAASPASGTRLGDCKGNSGITFDSPKTVYWNLAGTQNWNAVGWATTSTGTPDSTNFPLAQDTAKFTNAGSVTGTITINNPWNIGTIDMSGRTSAMTLGNTAPTANPPTLYGNWINGSGSAFSGTNGYVVFSGRSSQTITSAGISIPYFFQLNSIGGTLTLQDDLTLTRGTNTFSLINGTLDLNGKTFNCTTTSAVATFQVLNGTRNITFNGGTLSIAAQGSPYAFAVYSPSGFTTTAGTGTGKIVMTSASAKGFNGAGAVFNCVLDQGGAGALTIAGANTFNDITNSYSATGATTITLPASTTTTVNNFTASGTAGKLLTLQSSTSGTQATLSKASGTVSVSYVSIKDSNATGGALWQAYTINGNVNSGNNAGWDFGGTVQAGNGLLFGSNF